MERVNKIAINVDTEHNEVRVSLYRTNALLGILTDEDLMLPRFVDSGVSIKAYQNYCRDLVIELLNIDGVPGFYYEPKAEAENIKYDPSAFRKRISEYIEQIVGCRYEYKMCINDDIKITEQYKDKYIKSATGRFEIMLTQHDIRITILAEIKSGQMCRPRTFEFDDTEYGLNVTNIGRIIKSQ